LSIAGFRLGGELTSVSRSLHSLSRSGHCPNRIESPVMCECMIEIRYPAVFIPDHD
jgi:hypothetical protein